MAANPEHRYTVEEYIELDKRSEERLEYFNGEVVVRAGRLARRQLGTSPSRLLKKSET